MKQIIGEEQVDLYLCETCARQKGINKSDDSIELSLSQLLTGLLRAESETQTQEEPSVCLSCGTTIQTVRKEGRLGCPECYASFASEVRGIQKKLTGTIHHSGKLPKKLKEYKELIIDKQELQNQLDRAIGNEDYESAAILRDRIREIDRQSDG